MGGPLGALGSWERACIVYGVEREATGGFAHITQSAVRAHCGREGTAGSETQISPARLSNQGCSCISTSPYPSFSSASLLCTHVILPILLVRIAAVYPRHPTRPSRPHRCCISTSSYPFFSSASLLWRTSP